MHRDQIPDYGDKIADCEPEQTGEPSPCRSSAETAAEFARVAALLTAQGHALGKPDGCGGPQVLSTDCLRCGGVIIVDGEDGSLRGNLLGEGPCRTLQAPHFPTEADARAFADGYWIEDPAA